ncbi:MAG: hypothetical protein ACR2NZ_05915 [Rubripirellula sp.]
MTLILTSSVTPHKPQVTKDQREIEFLSRGSSPEAQNLEKGVEASAKSRAVSGVPRTIAETVVLGALEAQRIDWNRPVPDAFPFNLESSAIAESSALAESLGIVEECIAERGSGLMGKRPSVRRGPDT